MKKILPILLTLVLAATSAYSLKTLHDFKAETIDGDTLDFSVYEGKKLMIVNTASLCGFTYQYEILQTVYEQYKQYDFEIVGFPSNDFGSQEPGSDEDIKEFCQNKGVTFQMMSKIHVKGANQHPIYKWLTTKSLNGFADSEVSWNFQKYLINKEGGIDKIVVTQADPDDEAIIDWIMEGTSVEDKSSEIKVYPNPSTGNLIIDTEYIEDPQAEILLYNSIGEKVKEISQRQTNVSDLPSGSYFLEIIRKDLRIVKKVIISADLKSSE